MQWMSLPVNRELIFEMQVFQVDGESVLRRSAVGAMPLVNRF